MAPVFGCPAHRAGPPHSPRCLHREDQRPFDVASGVHAVCRLDRPLPSRAQDPEEPRHLRTLGDARSEVHGFAEGHDSGKASDLPDVENHSRPFHQQLGRNAPRHDQRPATGGVGEIRSGPLDRTDAEAEALRRNRLEDRRRRRRNPGNAFVCEPARLRRERRDRGRGRQRIEPGRCRDHASGPEGPRGCLPLLRQPGGRFRRPRPWHPRHRHHRRGWSHGRKGRPRIPLRHGCRATLPHRRPAHLRRPRRIHPARQQLRTARP